MKQSIPTRDLCRFTSLIMSIQWLLTLFLLPSFARATMIPVSPGPGDVFRSGSPCPISWDTDRSGSTQPWRNATICMQSQHHPIFILKFGYHTVLMSGSNLNMSRVTVVVERLDGTNISSYNWLCPNVTPNADIYFYQVWCIANEFHMGLTDTGTPVFE